MEKVLRAEGEVGEGVHLLVQRQFACLSGSLCHCPLVPFDCVLSNCGSNKLQEEATIRNILHALQRSLPLHLSLSPHAACLSFSFSECAPSVSLFPTLLRLAIVCKQTLHQKPSLALETRSTRAPSSKNCYTRISPSRQQRERERK